MTRRRARIIWALTCLICFAAAGSSTVRADEEARATPSSRGGRAAAVAAVVRERAVAHDVSPWLLEALATCESRLDPEAVGAAGELGLMQLHPRGLLPAFYRMGFDDPWSVYQQADFAAWAIANGYARHWSCWRVVTS
jgi:hypothetical protein